MTNVTDRRTEILLANVALNYVAPARPKTCITAMTKVRQTVHCDIVTVGSITDYHSPTRWSVYRRVTYTITIHAHVDKCCTS